MSKFDDDLARGCLPTGEPLESLYGVGWWTEHDEPVPYPYDLYIAELESRIAELEAENAELKERVAMLDVTAVYKSLGEMGYIEQVDKLNARIAELELGLNNQTVHSNTLQKILTEKLARIAELEEAQRWRVVADGDLPIVGKSIMFYDSSSEEIYRGVYTASHHWQANYFSEKCGTVTHWMPIPQPPEVQE